MESMCATCYMPQYHRAKQAIGRAAAAPLPNAGLSSHQRIRATSAPEGSTLRACPSEPRRDLNHRTIVPRPLVQYSSPTVTILYLFTLHTTLLSSTSFTSAQSTKKARQSPYYTQPDLRLSVRCTADRLALDDSIHTALCIRVRLWNPRTHGLEK